MEVRDVLMETERAEASASVLGTRRMEDDAGDSHKVDDEDSDDAESDFLKNPVVVMANVENTGIPADSVAVTVDPPAGVVKDAAVAEDTYEDNQQQEKTSDSGVRADADTDHDSQDAAETIPPTQKMRVDSLDDALASAQEGIESLAVSTADADDGKQDLGSGAGNPSVPPYEAQENKTVITTSTPVHTPSGKRKGNDSPRSSEKLLKSSKVVIGQTPGKNY